MRVQLIDTDGKVLFSSDELTGDKLKAFAVAMETGTYHSHLWPETLGDEGRNEVRYLFGDLEEACTEEISNEVEPRTDLSGTP